MAALDGMVFSDLKGSRDRLSFTVNDNDTVLSRRRGPPETLLWQSRSNKNPIYKPAQSGSNLARVRLQWDLLIFWGDTRD